MPLACAAVILLGAALRLYHAGDVKTRTPDERVYTAQAGVLMDRGVAGMRALSVEYLRDPAQRLYPPPTRIGYTGPLAAAMKLMGSRSQLVGSWISCIASIAALILATTLGYRFFHPLVGLLTAVFLSVFPPELVLARRTWQEALVNCLALVLIYCACSIAGQPGQWRAYIWMGIAGAALLPIKESSPMIYGPCLLWAGVPLLAHRRWREFARLMVSAVLAAGIAAAIVGWIAGGLAVEQKVLAGLFPANASNPYALRNCTGPGYLLFAGFWTLSPAVTTLAVPGLFLALCRRARLARNPWNGTALAAFTILFGLLPVILPHWLNLRYVSVLNAPLCLLAAIAARESWGWIRRQFTPPEIYAPLTIACVALAIAAIGDYQRFDRRFVQNETADLAIRMVLDSPD